MFWKFNSNNEASKTKTKYIIIFVIALIVILLLILVFKNNGNNSENPVISENKSNLVYPKSAYKYLQLDEKYEILPENDSKNNKNINIVSIYMGKTPYDNIDSNDNEYGNYIIIYGKNNNSIPLNIGVNLELLNEKNELIEKTTEQVYAVKANSEFALKIRSQIKSNIEFATYRLTYYTNEVDSSYTSLDLDKSKYDIEIKKDNNSRGLDMNYTSKYLNNIDSIAILNKYYKNNNLVFVDTEIVYNIISNKDKEIHFELWRVNDKFYDYDKVEHVIFSSYNNTH